MGENEQLPVRGQHMSLKLIKESVFPDGVSYYVLEDYHGRRFLLPAEYYRSYGFSAGQKVEAVVDHINCNGRIFIEPQHPRFRTGQLARFTLKVVFSSPSGFFPAVVNDVTGLEYNVVFARGIPPQTKHVLLPISTVSKGIVYPEWPAATGLPLHTPEFPVICFYEGTYLLKEGDTYHLIVYDGIPALVKARNYGWFSPVAGGSVVCLLYRNKNGAWRAEPENPEYRYGQKMLMTVEKTYTVDDLMLGMKQRAYLKDDLGRYHTVMIGSVKRYQAGERYGFRVSGYKEGRVVWEEE